MRNRSSVGGFVQAELGEGFVVSGQGLDFVSARGGEVALHLQNRVGGALAVLELLLFGGQGFLRIFAGPLRVAATCS